MRNLRIHPPGSAAFILVAGLFHAHLAPGAQDVAQPEWVRQVVAGKRNEARVSWWGFNATDSTEFLQKAINSHVKRLIIDRQPSAWISGPLTGVGNQELVFEAGTELVALKGAFRGKGDCLLSFPGCTNVIIRGQKKDGGKSAHIRMQKADYQSGAYEKSEWRHGLSLFGCRKVLIQDLAIESTGGDGIYLGVASDKKPNVNVVIRRVDCHNNHRQGISVISAEKLLVEDCRLRNTAGTAPQAGIDFEPNDPEDSLSDCVVRRCVAENNAGTGYQICPQSLRGRSKPISIYLEDCVSRGNTQHAIHLCSAQKDAPGGLLRITRFLSDNDAMAGLSVQFNPYDAVRIEMSNSEVRDSARKDSFFPPLYVQGVDSDHRPAGNIHFKHLLIKDDVERPFLKFREGKGDGVRDITGDIILKRNGRTESITIDDAWLRQFTPSAARPSEHPNSDGH